MPKPAAKKSAPRSAWPLYAEAVLRGYLAPRLAADAEIDLKPVIAAYGTPKRLKNGTISGLNPTAFRGALDKALAPKGDKVVLAADADVADIQEAISMMEDKADEIADLVVSGPSDDVPPGDDPAPNGDPAPVPPGNTDNSPTPPAKAVDPDGDGKVENADPVAAVMSFLADKLSPEDLDRIKEMFVKKSDDKGPPAMDAAAVQEAINAAVTAQATRFKGAQAAMIAVRPYVGTLAVAMDSADEVYTFALKKLGVDVKNVHPSAFPAILKAQPLPNARSNAPRPPIAQDSAPPKVDFGPQMARIGLG